MWSSGAEERMEKQSKRRLTHVEGEISISVISRGNAVELKIRITFEIFYLYIPWKVPLIRYSKHILTVVASTLGLSALRSLLHKIPLWEMVETF